MGNSLIFLLVAIYLLLIFKKVALSQFWLTNIKEGEPFEFNRCVFLSSKSQEVGQSATPWQS